MGRMMLRRWTAGVVAGVVGVVGLFSSASPADAIETIGPTQPVVLVGVTGLRWSDVSSGDTPTLDRLARTWAIGNAAVRSVRFSACPADGWLAVSSGTRAADLPSPECRTLDNPVDGVVPGWSDYLDAAQDDGYAAHPGLLGDLLAESGVQARGFGPGAAIALSRSDGTVHGWAPAAGSPEVLGGQVSDALAGGARFVAVDLGSVASEDDLARIDAALMAVLRATDDANVLVVSLADRGDVPELQLAAARSTGGHAALLSSASTRQPGLVLGTDVTATVLAELGTADDTIGSPMYRGPVEPAHPVPVLVDQAKHATVARPLVRWFYLGLVLTNLVLYAGVWFGLARRSRPEPDERRRRLVLRQLQVVSLFVGAAPIGLLVANQVPWWRAASPAAVLLVVAALVAAVVVVAALVGPWRRTVLGPAGLVAAVTAVVIVADVLTGARLQVSAVLGVPTLAAGRFYGFNNTAFALAATAAIIATAALVDPMVRDGRRSRAAVGTAAVGVLLTAIDGSPGLGADFGGPPALIPAFTAMTLLVGGARITVRRVGAVLAGASAVTALFALLDWLRPPEERTHLGKLVQTLLDGGLWPVLERKASANLEIIANNRPLTALTIVGAGLVVAVLVKPIRRTVLSPDGGRYAWLSQGTALNRMSESAPTFAPSLLAVATLAVIGFAVNDSGISIPALSVALTIPLTMAAVATWLLGIDGTSDPTPTASAAAGASSSTTAGADAAAGAQPYGELVRPWSGQKADVHVGAAWTERRRWSVLVGVLGAVTLVVLLAQTLAPTQVSPGGVPHGQGTAISEPVVVIGVQGLRWQDIEPGRTPMVWSLIQGGAMAGGVSPGVTDADRRCEASGWLALSAGKPVVADKESGPACLPWGVIPTDGGATVKGWSQLVEAQSRSPYDPQLGTFGGAFDDVCATAVGPGAALALARQDGTVARYRNLDEAFTDPTGTFSCPVTIVDAGAAPYTVRSLVGSVVELGAPPATAVGSSRNAELAQLDARIGRIMAAAPASATVVLVDLGNPNRVRSMLGVGAVVSAQPTPMYLSSTSTRWEGVVRLLDLPSTVLDAAGVPEPAGLTGSPWVGAGARPDDVSETADALITQIRRDRALRGLSGWLTNVPLLSTLVAMGLLIGFGPWLRRRFPRLAAVTTRAVVALLTVMASLPAGLFAMTSWHWWEAAQPGDAMWVALVGATLLVAAVTLVAPTSPAWSVPAVVAGLTFVILTLDALAGTPLHRGSPLGPSPTLGGRYYGFGNPTFSVYVVAALVTAAAVGWWLRGRGHRWVGAGAAAVIGTTALLVDVLPSLGADVGGGLVLLPPVAMIVLAVAGVRLTWLRVVAAGALGALLVAGIGVVDWMRPPADRSHLGIFVQSVVDGTAWTTVARKAGYALNTLDAGPVAWLSVAIVVAGAVLVWPGSPVRLRWFDRVHDDWPMWRPLVGALLLVGVAGALVNDYGTRIITVLLAAGLPVLSLVVLRATDLTDVSDVTGRTAAAKVSGSDDRASDEPVER